MKTRRSASSEDIGFEFDTYRTISLPKGSVLSCLDYMLPHSLLCQKCENFRQSAIPEKDRNNPEVWVNYNAKRSSYKHEKYCCENQYNLPTIKASDVIAEVDEVIRALAHHGFNVRAIVSDSASCNQAFARCLTTIPAKQFISGDIVDGGEEKRSLDGDFLIAYPHYLTGEPIFLIDDPPHVLKRVGSAMENKKLTWGMCATEDLQPMSMALLKDVYQTISKFNGPFTLRSAKKLSLDHFEGTNYSKMKVKRSAQVLSRTMAGLIREVTANPQKYPMQHSLAGVPPEKRAHFFARALELCEKMDRWFDICNSKDKKRKRGHDNTWINKDTASQYADELLDILRWIFEWKDACTDVSGNVCWDCFLTQETFESFNYTCLSFASMLHYLCGKRGNSIKLRAINQDVVEKHFGHARAFAGNTDNPVEKKLGHDVTTANMMRDIHGIVDNGNVTKGETEK